MYIIWTRFFCRIGCRLSVRPRRPWRRVSIWLLNVVTRGKSQRPGEAFKASGSFWTVEMKCVDYIMHCFKNAGKNHTKDIQARHVGLKSLGYLHKRPRRLLCLAGALKVWLIDSSFLWYGAQAHWYTRYKQTSECRYATSFIILQ